MAGISSEHLPVLTAFTKDLHSKGIKKGCSALVFIKSNKGGVRFKTKHPLVRKFKFMGRVWPYTS